MPDFSLPMQVVAARIMDDPGRILLQQRPAGKHHAGLWEFPGGKVEAGESAPQALIREIAEELGLILFETGLVPSGSAQQPAGAGQRALDLHLYTAQEWEGEPQGREGQEWGWFTAEQAAALPLAPLDRQLLWKTTCGKVQ